MDDANGGEAPLALSVRGASITKNPPIKPVIAPVVDATKMLNGAPSLHRIVLLTLEKTLLVFAPIRRTVPITIIISTTSIIPYSATSWPSFPYHTARRNFKTALPKISNLNWFE